MVFDLKLSLNELVHLVVAYALAIPIGFNRAVSEQSAGLRTFPLVAVASCAFVITATVEFSNQSEAYSRVMQGTLQGVITGIGFIGGGAILKRELSVQGTATAASLWLTCAIGVATGFGNYTVAAFLSIVTFLTLRYLTPIERKLKSDE
jgi:putative Mg2+ transporter-C (MgtC) family protein